MGQIISFKKTKLMKKKIFEKMLYILLIYVLFGAFLFFYQRKLLYFPTSKISHNFEQQQLNHDNVTLKVIVLNKGE